MYNLIFTSLVNGIAMLPNEKVVNRNRDYEFWIIAEGIGDVMFPIVLVTGHIFIIFIIYLFFVMYLFFLFYHYLLFTIYFFCFTIIYFLPSSSF